MCFSVCLHYLPSFLQEKGLTISIESSNIANLGSDLEKQVRLEAARTEPAWKNAGKVPGNEG